MQELIVASNPDSGKCGEVSIFFARSRSANINCCNAILAWIAGLERMPSRAAFLEELAMHSKFNIGRKCNICAGFEKGPCVWLNEVVCNVAEGLEKADSIAFTNFLRCHAR